MFDVSDIEVDLGTDTMHIATFDANGDQSGEVSISSDGRELEVTFADGLYLTALTARANERYEIVELESPDTAEVSWRMAAVRDFDLAAFVDHYGGLIGAAGAVVVACGGALQVWDMRELGGRAWVRVLFLLGAALMLAAW